MAKDVDLLSYWMPFLKNLKEFKEIAKTEEPELRYILTAIERALANFFIDDADEWGIKRFEEMMGIIPNVGDSLEVRRHRIFIRWTDYIPFTDPVLYRRLLEICGLEDAFEIERHYKEYWIRIVTHITAADIYELVSAMIDEMIPCNLVLDYENILETLTSNTLYVGEICCTSMRYQITDDITSKADIETSIMGGGASSVGYWHKITHDADFVGAPNGEVYSGMSAGVVYARIITDDITSEVSIEGNSYVSDPAVSSGTTITINE